MYSLTLNDVYVHDTLSYMLHPCLATSSRLSVLYSLHIGQRPRTTCGVSEVTDLTYTQNQYGWVLPIQIILESLV